MIEVVYSFSAGGLLEKVNGLYSLFQDSKIALLNHGLAYGDISNLNTPGYRYVPEEKQDISEDIDNFNKMTENDKKIRIWTSKSDINEYLGFLFTLELLQDKQVELSTIFANEAVFEYTSKENGLQYYSPTCVGSCNEKHLKDNLLHIEKKLADDEVHTFLAEWQKIKKENSPLRILKNKKVKSVTLDYYDNTLLEILANHEGKLFFEDGSTTIGRLYGEFAGNCDNSIGDMFIVKRIEELIKSGKITVVEKNSKSKYDTKIIICS